MTTTTIPAGYRITVSSWENDADHCNTIIKEGLTEDQARFYCTMWSHMGSSSNGGRANQQFGNMYEPSDVEVEEFVEFFRTLFLNGGDVAKEILCDGHDVEWDDLMDEGNDNFPSILGKIIGDFTGSGDFFTRVVDTIKVEFVPVTITLTDVSDQFPKAYNGW